MRVGTIPTSGSLPPQTGQAGTYGFVGTSPTLNEQERNPMLTSNTLDKMPKAYARGYREGANHMNKFNVTYEIITEESSENGETEEIGFVVENVKLREAIDLVTSTESPHCSQSAIEANDSLVEHARWFTVYNSADYITGKTENRALHLPENTTGSSRRRIARLLGVN